MVAKLDAALLTATTTYGVPLTGVNDPSNRNETRGDAALVPKDDTLMAADTASAVPVPVPPAPNVPVWA
jgi:hypothetical protein